MKKIILLILEINSLVFAWYVFMGTALVGIDIASGGFLAHMGITRKTLYWIVGISTILEMTRLCVPALKKAPRLLREKTVVSMRDLCIFGLIVICAWWMSFQYETALAMAETASQGGLPSIFIRTAFAIILLFGAFMSGYEEIQKDIPQKNESEDAEKIKNEYRNREESSMETKKNRAFPLWRYAHEAEYHSIAAHIPSKSAVLDNGCGDGTLAILLAKKGAAVTACDISEGNITKAKAHAEAAGVAHAIRFVVADAENIPFKNDSFDWVVSSHVLEHIPHFEKGLSEIRRVTKKNAVIAMPTCLNPCAAVILGGDTFWRFSRWSPVAWFIGLGRIISNIGGIGVDEGYRGNKSLPHIWRFPHVMRNELKKGGFSIITFEASSLCLPYIERLLPFAKKMERLRGAPILKNCGYGSIAVITKNDS